VVNVMESKRFWGPLSAGRRVWTVQ